MADWQLHAEASLLAWRIPWESAWPEQPYVLAFDVRSERWPTFEEAETIGRYIRFLVDSRDERSHATTPNGNFDLTREFGTIVLHKIGDGDWAYRCTHWTVGPLFANGGPLLDVLHAAMSGVTEGQWRDFAKSLSYQKG